MSSGKSKKKKRQIKQKPTTATNEEEVSEADKQLHKKIAAQVKARLEEKGKSSESVEIFEAFYELIKQEARKLQQEYQPQLRNGIKIAVDLVNSVQKDKKDGDVDVKVNIAPNSFEVTFNIPENEQGRFKKLLYEALVLLGDELYEESKDSKGSRASKLKKKKKG